MNKPIAYMHQGQVQTIFQTFKSFRNRNIPVLAFGFDNWDVFHVYTSPAKTQLAGYPCPSIVHFLDSIPEGESGYLFASQLLGEVFNGSGNSAAAKVVVLLAFENGGIRHRFFVNTQESFLEGTLKFIPEHSELYSRSRGLLETSILEKRKVGVVGLGSGGSLIAVELAKAGVGNFVLIDFDRLELGNIARHVCGIGDLGRYKTMAVRDLLYGKNPYINVTTAEIDINSKLDDAHFLLKDCDLIVAATDNDRSRFNLNSVALEHKITSLFGRALTRASGGDILKVRPFEGPCVGCVFTREFIKSFKEEVSQFKQARASAPAYVSDEDVNASVQVGLSSDIMPISNMMVKLALVELSRGTAGCLNTLEEDLVADFYIWANRRENTYASWPRLEYGSRTPSILRWYGAKWERKLNCPVCGEL